MIILDSETKIVTHNFNSDEINEFFINSVAAVKRTFTSLTLSVYLQSISFQLTFNFSKVTTESLIKMMTRPTTTAAGLDNTPLHYPVKTGLINPLQHPPFLHYGKRPLSSQYLKLLSQIRSANFVLSLCSAPCRKYSNI